MATAEIIAIGTELLLGEIQDTNTSFLARSLRDAGIDLYRATVIGDNEVRIARSIQEALERCDIVITTGGLGPTVDDPTRQAVAIALGVEQEFRPELWQQIAERFRRAGREATENNRRQAYIPAGAQPVENPVGTAPAFICHINGKVVISLPGVPREMEYLLNHSILPFLKSHFQLNETIRAYVLHTAGVGESQVDEWVADLETLSNPTVGLLAHPGQVDIRVTAKAASLDEIEHMIEETVSEIRSRVGDAIYGVNEDTLESVALRRLSELGWGLGVVECCLNGELTRRLQVAPSNIPLVFSAVETCGVENLRKEAEELRKQPNTQAVLAASMESDGRRQLLTLMLLSPQGSLETVRTYSGPSQNAALWATNTALDFLRRMLPTP